MSNKREAQPYVTRSRLATTAHRLVMSANSEKDAARQIVEELRLKEGIDAELEVAEVNSENHWVAIVPAKQTNYGKGAESIAVVPDMSVSKDFTRSHIGVITPNNNGR